MTTTYITDLNLDIFIPHSLFNIKTWTCSAKISVCLCFWIQVIDV